MLITLAFRVKFYLLDASFVLGPRICVVNLRRNHGNHSRIFLAFTAAAFFIVTRFTATGTRLLRIYNFIFKDSFWNELRAPVFFSGLKPLRTRSGAFVHRSTLFVWIAVLEGIISAVLLHPAKNPLSSPKSLQNKRTGGFKQSILVLVY